MSTSEDYFYDAEWSEEEEETNFSTRSKPRNRKKYQELRRRAEDRLTKKRLKEQLGVYDYDDLDKLEF
ncbi:MAG: hypothetical protein MI976_09630 [Pseudomonadales bacterium]|nr:hypothetical protein [Pseudomonadales bacterium]